MIKYRKKRRTPQQNDFGLDLTSLTDITLTLLIIFVIVAPVLHGGVTINLPQANTQPLEIENEHLTISIDYAGRVYLNNDTAAVPDLESAIVARTRGNRATPIFVKADRKVEYQSVFFVLSTLKEMNYQKVSLVSITNPSTNLPNLQSSEEMLDVGTNPEPSTILPATFPAENP